MSSASQVKITVSALHDVLDIRAKQFKLSGQNPKNLVPGQRYVVSVKSDAKYAPPVKKVVIYNTTDNNPKGWFYIVEEGSPIVITTGIKGTEHEKVYAFFIDITSGDNTGSATVTFDPVC